MGKDEVSTVLEWTALEWLGLSGDPIKMKCNASQL